MNPVYYHVAPRYSAGSPAQVDEATALRVAAQEKSAYNHHIEGMYGDFKRKMAAEKGLEGIVYRTLEKGNKIYVDDLITNAQFIVPIKEWSGNVWHSRPDRTKYIRTEMVSQ